MPIQLTVNGRVRESDSPPDTPLLWVLRDDLGLTGTKFGCGVGACGACTVHIDGRAAHACQVPLSAVTSRTITTIEGAHDRTMDALRRAWLAEDVAQCGYCQTGQLLAAAVLLADTPSPDDAQIDAAMRGNICRCGTYGRIRRAIHRAAAEHGGPRK